MKIKSGLPQFAAGQALLIVLGKQTGIFYKAGKGTLTEVGEYEVPTPKFSDKEGFYESRGHGLVIRSGAMQEPQKEYVIKEAEKLLKKTLKQLVIREQPTEVYLYAPAPVMKGLKEEVKKIVKEAYKNSYLGNYTQLHPFELLTMLKQRKERKVVKSVPDKARKLLKK